MKATRHDPTELFPAFAQAEAKEDQQRQIAVRQRQIEEHRNSMKFCWPEWTGPQANGPGTSGFCEVHSLTAYGLMHGEGRYHYMAACRIESVSADGLTVVAVVEYDESVWCRGRYNGERLRVDITDVWPLCRLLRARRDERKSVSASVLMATHSRVST